VKEGFCSKEAFFQTIDFSNKTPPQYFSYFQPIPPYLRPFKILKSPHMSDKRNASIWFIFITLLIDVIGFGVIIPVIPQLIQTLTGGDLSAAATWGGWLMFTYAVMQFVFAPIIGALSDQYGRRPVLLASLFAFGLDYLLAGFAPSIGWLFAARMVAGVTGASFSTATAYIADISTNENRAQNFGMIGAAFGLGFIIGPVLGGVLGDFGMRVPFFAAATLALLNWLYGFFILPESLSVENRRKFDWRKANPVGSVRNLGNYPFILGLVAALMLVYISGHANQSTWSYITIEKFKWTQKEIGFSLAWVGLMVGLVQGVLSRRIIPKLGQKRAVYVGLGLYAVGFTLFAFATEGWMMYAFMMVFALGGIAGPSLQSLISSQVPPNEQGGLQGTLTSLISITTIIGPLLMNNLFSYFTHANAPIYFAGAPFLMGALLALLSAVLAFRALR
jgi:MFS transporter, DHA1 family, tetracycline resistance protein